MFKTIQGASAFNDLLQNGAIAIDVRSEAEYNEGKIPNSLTGFDWNSGEFMDKIDDLDPDKTYVLICRSGNRSMQACSFLTSSGFQNLYNLEGGMMEWDGEVVS